MPADAASGTAPASRLDYADFVRQRKDAIAQGIRDRRARSLRIADGIADAKVRRAFLLAEAQHERDIADFWRRFFRRRRPAPDAGTGQDINSAAAAARPLPTPGRRSPHATGRSSPPPSGAVQLAAYGGPVLDRRHRRGVYLSATYLGAKTDQGCARRLVRYVTDPGHVEWLDGVALLGSNVGEDRAEMSAAFGLVEDLNRAARANAKIVFHLIVQLPHDVTPADRATIMRRWCEDQFGARNLPYVWAVHTPDVDGDQRNSHGHVAVSFRPLVRVAPYAWDAARELSAELDNPAQFRVMREQFARVMTEVAQEAGRNREYTALSHAARGLKIKPTEHLGAHKARIVREGGYVAADARNRARITRNEAMLGIERLKRRLVAMERRLAVVRRIEARATSPVHAVDQTPRARIARTSRPSSSARPERARQAIISPRAAHRVGTSLPATRRPVPAVKPAKPTTLDVAAIATIPRDSVGSAVLSRPVYAAVRPQAGHNPAAAPLIARVRPETPISSTTLAPPVTQRSLPAVNALITVQSARRLLAYPDTVARPELSNRPRSAGTVIGSPATVRRVPAEAMPKEVLLAVAMADRPLGEGMTLPATVTRRATAGPPPVTSIVISSSERPPAASSGIDHDLWWAAFGEPGRRRRAKAKAGAPLAVLAACARVDWARSAVDSEIPLDRAETLDDVGPLTPTPIASIAARVRKADLYVHDDGTGRLVLDPRAMIALKVGDADLDAPAEQAALADIRKQQQRIVADLVVEAERRPLAFSRSGSRPWPRDLDPAMLARLDRWSGDEGFRQDLFLAVELPIGEAYRVEDARRNATRAAATLPVAPGPIGRSLPDGFGGTRRTPPPAHIPSAPAGVRIAARDSGTGAPTVHLLALARVAGQQPRLVDRAADGRLTTLPGAPKVAAALIDLWRHDKAIDELVTRIVTDSCAAGRPVWPADIAAALRAQDRIGTRPPPAPDLSRGPQR